MGEVPECVNCPAARARWRVRTGVGDRVLCEACGEAARRTAPFDFVIIETY